MKRSENIFLGIVFFAVIVIGTIIVLPHRERLVGLAADVVPKTVMIEVVADVRQTQLVISDRGLSVETSTVTMRILGSGVFISPRGHVLTCGHLFTEGKIKSITVKRFNGDEYAGEKVAIDVKRDLALLKIYEDTPNYAKLASPRSLEVGQEVLAVGNPLGLEFSVTHGILSALNRDNTGGYNTTQSDTFINPGNSGGPLFNMNGELVGINSYMIPVVNAPIFTGCGFSVQPGQIIEFITTIKDKIDGLPSFHGMFS